jgi:GAF domain-containing protein
VTARRALATLHELACEPEAPPDRGRRAQRVIDVLEAELGFEYLAVLTPVPGAAGLEPLALSRQGQGSDFLERDMAFVRARTVPGGGGITGWVARTRVTARIDDVMDDSRYMRLREGIRSELCVPVVIGGELAAIINTESPRRGVYSRSDQRLLETAAHHAASTIGPASAHPEHAAWDDEDAPIVTTCSYCQNFRLDGQTWVRPERYVADRPVRLSHGMCPRCFDRYVNLI